MEKYYFTFGLRIVDAYSNCYHVEVAEDYGKARERMVEKFGTGWAFQYTEEEWRINREEYQQYIQFGRCSVPWHEGFTLADLFNLKEI